MTSTRSSLKITFRGVPHSAALEEKIREKVDKVEQLYDRITACHVVIDAPHRHHRKGKSFNVRIDLSVPGQELTISRDRAKGDSHADVYVALRDAFAAAARQLEDYSERQRERVHGRGRTAS